MKNKLLILAHNGRIKLIVQKVRYVIVLVAKGSREGIRILGTKPRLFVVSPNNGYYSHERSKKND
jgi:hypothetical protein